MPLNLIEMENHVAKQKLTEKDLIGIKDLQEFLEKKKEVFANKQREFQTRISEGKVVTKNGSHWSIKI